MKRYLICTDLDRTLIPNGAQSESAAAKELFKRMVRREDVMLAYVSGRHRALIEQAIAEFDLPQPDFAIADVGTTTYQVDMSGWQSWGEWDVQIAPDWQGLNRDELQHLLGIFPALRLQEKEKQGRYKLSFYIALDVDAQKLMSEVEARLKYADIRANLIWSIDEKMGLGLLDVLPASANKLHAIRFLMQQKGFCHENTIFAGDSGNDLDVLLSDIPSVLVANAGDEVKSRAEHAHKDTCYIAKGNYLGMNGNYRAGVLEGVAHYWPEVGAWLREQK